MGDWIAKEEQELVDLLTEYARLLVSKSRAVIKGSKCEVVGLCWGGIQEASMGILFVEQLSKGTKGAWVFTGNSLARAGRWDMVEEMAAKSIERSM